jgi:hypothetical protein
MLKKLAKRQCVARCEELGGAPFQEMSCTPMGAFFGLAPLAAVCRGGMRHVSATRTSVHALTAKFRHATGDPQRSSTPGGLAPRDRELVHNPPPSAACGAGTEYSRSRYPKEPREAACVGELATRVGWRQQFIQRADGYGFAGSGPRPDRFLLSASGDSRQRKF